MKSEGKRLLQEKIHHIDIKMHDTRALIDAMAKMSFSAREVANAARIFNALLKDKDAVSILTIAGSTSAAGCMQVYVDMVRANMVDIIVATGATVIDMDFFEALGFSHYRGTQSIDDQMLRKQYVDRIYDTFINERELQACDSAICEVADQCDFRPYSSREFIYELGKWLAEHPRRAKKKDSLVQVAYECDVPIFCPAFSDSSAGLGLVKHQVAHPDKHVTIDSVRDFRELTQLKIHERESGLFMIGGGTPKNFTQDVVICAEVIGHMVPTHKYAVQLTVADMRDGACSSSTLKEAGSWGKVNVMNEQMVYGEATVTLPIIVADAYHRGYWKKRKQRKLSRLFTDAN